MPFRRESEANRRAAVAAWRLLSVAGLRLPHPRRLPMKYTSPLVIALMLGVTAGSARADEKAPDAAEIKKVVDKALEFLKPSQAPDGSFTAKRAGPGITAVVAAGLLRAGVSPKDPVLEKALQFLEKSVKADGGIYDKGLANYTTSVGV